MLDVLVVDDDVLVGRVVKRLAPPDVIVRCTTSKARAIESLRDATWSCTVALIDVRLGRDRLGGLDVVEVALAERPSVTCVLVTGSNDIEVKRRAFDRHVRLLPKPFTKEQLASVFDGARAPSLPPPTDALAECIEKRALEWRLSRRPREVLRLLATNERRPHEETARALGIGLNTLRAHVQAILFRSGLPSVDAVRETLLRDSLSLSARGGPGSSETGGP